MMIRRAAIALPSAELGLCHSKRTCSRQAEALFAIANKECSIRTIYQSQAKAWQDSFIHQLFVQTQSFSEDHLTQKTRLIATSLEPIDHPQQEPPH